MNNKNLQVSKERKDDEFYTLYEDIEKEISRFEEKGCVVVSELKPAILFGGKRVAFLMTPTGLIELVEE